MADTKKYYIEINGIKESVDAVDSLLKKLENLEQRIDAISQKQATVSTASDGSGGGGSKSRVSDLTAEQKIIDQINRSQEKREALEGEIGKMLADEKQAMKELNAEQKSLAAKDRLAAGGYDSNTMLGMKAELADIKAAMQTMEVGSEEMLKAAQRADELNTKLKEIEYSYGQFGRNVGNYPTAIIDEMNGITIALGDQRMQFNSTREALRTLRENIKQMTVEGKQNTEEYDNQIKALHELEMALQEADSAINDVKVSSQGMDEALDWMQSFGAMGQITQGFSAFFGSTGFEESIRKLMSLQSMLQGLEQLRKQMNTGEGFGKMFNSLSQGADEAAAKLLMVKGGMEGVAAASKVTQVAVKGLSVVIKGLAGLGIGLLIDGAMKLAEKVGNLVGSLFGWDKANDALVSSSDVASAAIERQKNHLAELEDQAKKDFLLGKITEQEYLAQKTQLATRAIQEEIEAYRTLVALGDEDKMSDERKENLKYGLQEGKDYGYAEGLVPAPPIVINSWDELLDKLEEYEKKVSEGVDQTQEFYGAWTAILPDFNDGVKDTKKVFETLVDVTLGEFMNKYEEAMKMMASGTKEGVDKATDEIKKLYDLIKDDGILNSVFLNLGKYFDDNELIAKLKNIKSEIKGFMSGITFTGDDLEQLKLDALPSKERRRALIEKEYEADKKKFASNAEAMELVEKKHQNQLNELAGAGGAKRVSTAKHTAKSTLDIEKETQQMRIQMMSEGILKTIAQLNKERDEKLKKFRQNKQMELEINRYYDKKIAEERKKWLEKMAEEERQIWARVFSYNRETIDMESNALMDDLDITIKQIKDRQKISLYDIFFTETKGGKFLNGEYLSEAFKNLQDLIEIRNNAKQKGTWTEYQEKQFEILYTKMKKVYDLQKDMDGLDFDQFLNLFSLYNYGDSLETFTSELEQTSKKWNDILTQSKRTFEEYYKQREELLNKEISAEKEAVTDWQREEEEKTKAHYKELMDNVKNDDERVKYERKQEEVLARIRQEALDRDTALTVKHSIEEQKLENERRQKINDIHNQEYTETLDKYADFKRQIEQIAEQQPKRSAWGFINVKETNRINEIVLKGLKKLRDEITLSQTKLQDLYENEEIDIETFDRLTRMMSVQMDGVNQKIKETADALSWKGKLQDFFQNLQQYYSAVSDSFQSILSEFQNNQDYMIERQMDALDKENEELQKKLEENEKILERHKNNVDKIEGELADARGDRRERLIDALNQEIIAQRRAQAEKEKLEKEQEKIEERQRELEKKQKEYEYQRGLQQILFQTSQAIMQAATNNWPIPAIPLMALAAATGAAQYALARQRKPYAEGGILDGLSHENGGISVGNSNIEVEGGEYVVNKRSTANNTELLNLINNSDRQLTPSDLMNFATNMSVSPLEVNMPESSSLETAFVAYAQRPIVVDVREITSRQESVRNVQVLSGIR